MWLATVTPNRHLGACFESRLHLGHPRPNQSGVHGNILCDLTFINCFSYWRLALLEDCYWWSASDMITLRAAGAECPLAKAT